MLEIAPKKYWITGTWADVSLYGQFLNVDGKVGWRLPKNEVDIDTIQQTLNDPTDGSAEASYYQQNKCSYYWTDMKPTAATASAQLLYDQLLPDDFMQTFGHKGLSAIYKGYGGNMGLFVRDI